VTLKNTFLVPIYLLSALSLSGLYYFIAAIKGESDLRAWQCSETNLIVLGLFLLFAMLGGPRRVLAYKTFVIALLGHGALFGVLATFGPKWSWTSSGGYLATIITPTIALLSGWAIGLIAVILVLLRRSAPLKS